MPATRTAISLITQPLRYDAVHRFGPRRFRFGYRRPDARSEKNQMIAPIMPDARVSSPRASNPTNSSCLRRKVDALGAAMSPDSPATVMKPAYRRMNG